MAQPNLIHPMKVTLEAISRIATIFDPDSREPVGTTTRANAVTIDGQLSSSLRVNAFAPSRTGRVEDENGYVLFRTLDLANKGLVDDDTRPFGLADGDKITSIAGKKVALFVIRAEPLGSDTQLGFTLVKAFLSDRKPSEA